MFKLKSIFYFNVLFFISISLFAQGNCCNNRSANASCTTDSNSIKVSMRPEHIAFNVDDPIAQAKWFVDNMGFKIMYKGNPPGNTRFVSDAGENMMIELYYNKDYPVLDFSKLNHLTIHLAFMADSIESAKKKLLGAGAILVEDITKTPSGDLVLMLRNPWGLPIQFVQRAKPMLKYSLFRPEHLALNIPDPVAKSKWLVENLGMKIIKQGSAPSYSTFIADGNNNMMLELYHNESVPFLDFKNTSYMSLHFAFMVNDIDAVKSRLVSAGVKVLEDLKKSANGTIVLMIQDPFDQPIQFVKRVEPMLK
jgi:glyoxylase I family protein